MSGFDMNRVYSVSVHDRPAPSQEAPSETTKLLTDFLLQFRVGGEFIYRYLTCLYSSIESLAYKIIRSDKLRANLLLKQYHLEVDLRHVALYNEDLAHSVQHRPGDVLPLVFCTTNAFALSNMFPCSLKWPQRKRLGRSSFP